MNQDPTVSALLRKAQGTNLTDDSAESWEAVPSFPQNNQPAPVADVEKKSQLHIYFAQTGDYHDFTVNNAVLWVVLLSFPGSPWWFIWYSNHIKGNSISQKLSSSLSIIHSIQSQLWYFLRQQ